MKHFKRICIECEKVIAQCRCMCKNKSIEHDVCEDCRDKMTSRTLTIKELIEKFLIKNKELK